MHDLTIPAFTWRMIANGFDGPGPRSRHGLVYDRNAGATVLFGGIVWIGNGLLKSDTWELKGGSWSPVDVVEQPPPRHRGAMVFDEQRGFSVLFGGQADSGTMLGDTWTYAERSWRRRKSWWGRRPAPRCGHALAYDEETGQTVLFGGIGPSDRNLGDTWVFNGQSWREVRCPISPSPRRYAAMAYDPFLQGCLLHGGSFDELGRRQFGDAWLFRDQTWTLLPIGFETDARDDHGLAYHRSAQTMILLEGLRGPRGVLGYSTDGWLDGWQTVPTEPLHPLHQCAPLAWDDTLDGLVLHGGEVRHLGPQFNTTLVLRLARR